MMDRIQLFAFCVVLKIHEFTLQKLADIATRSLPYTTVRRLVRLDELGTFSLEAGFNKTKKSITVITYAGIY